MKEESNNVPTLTDFDNQSGERQGTAAPLPTAQRKTRAPANLTRQRKPSSTAPLARTAAQRFAQAVWGPLAGLLVNIVLVVIKVFAGLASGSVALLADAGHSGADVANNVLVLASLFYARRGADETHPYGHDRAEVLAVEQLEALGRVVGHVRPFSSTSASQEPWPATPRR